MRDYDLEYFLKRYGDTETRRQGYLKSDELAHYGVRGMRWRYKKGITIDPNNKNIRMRKPNGSVRVEKEKNISLSGGANKRFTSSERDIQNPAENTEFSKKASEAAKKDQEDREKREEAIRNAYDNALKKAQERANELKNKNGGGSSKGSNSGEKSTEETTTTANKQPAIKKNDNDKFREINRRDREYTYQQNAINKANGVNRVNVMNDKTETDKKFKKK